MKKTENKELLKKINLFIYNNEYSLLELAGLFCGFLIIFIANRFFVTSNIYFVVFFSGVAVGSFGFLIEYYIKLEKRKAVDIEFNYFLYDLSKEYKKSRNLSLALSNISEYNFYGSINSEIKRLSNRVSWGESFEEALYSINYNINSPLITHTLLLLEVLKKSTIDYEKILENISKDIQLFKSESRNRLYFANLFNLSIFFYFLFIFVLLYIDYVIGSNFLWYSTGSTITRVFFDNFTLYIAILLGAFTAYVMYIIKKDRGINLVKYMAILLVITVVLFQTFIPKPDAEEVIVDTIEYMLKNNTENVELNHIITLKAISSTYISDNTKINIHFLEKNCVSDCEKYTILVSQPTFYDFRVVKNKEGFEITYNISE